MISYLLANGKSGQITDPAILREFYERISKQRAQRVAERLSVAKSFQTI